MLVDEFNSAIGARSQTLCMHIYMQDVWQHLKSVSSCGRGTALWSFPPTRARQRYWCPGRARTCLAIVYPSAATFQDLELRHVRAGCSVGVTS